MLPQVTSNKRQAEERAWVVMQEILGVLRREGIFYMVGQRFGWDIHLPGAHRTAILVHAPGLSILDLLQFREDLRELGLPCLTIRTWRWPADPLWQRVLVKTFVSMHS